MFNIDGTTAFFLWLWYAGLPLGIALGLGFALGAWIF